MRKDTEVRSRMFEMIERWKQSGLSQKAFCEGHSMKFHQFYYWYKQYHLLHVPANSDDTSFVRLQVDKSAIAAPIEIHFPGGTRLLFHGSVSADYLKSLIH